MKTRKLVTKANNQHDWFGVWADWSLIYNKKMKTYDWDKSYTSVVQTTTE
jgi:hypothetical protein